MNTKAKTTFFYASALFLTVLSVIAVFAAYFLLYGRDQIEHNTISVRAEAKAYATPDIARFSFTVREKGENPEAAQKKVNDKVGKILEGLRKLGVDEKDIRTESYMIRPKYEWVSVKKEEKVSPEGIIYYPPEDGKKRILVGYEVSQRIHVKLRDFDKIPEALSLFAENGVENLSGPRFEIEDIDAVKEKARMEAIEKAKEKAERLAKALGVKLGKVVSFQEDNGGYIPYRAPMLAMKAMDMAGEEAYEPELPAGENEVRSSVSIVYEIK